jgi:Zn-dependent membrane protease YugP
MIFDPLYMLIIMVTMGLSLWAQARVKGAYHKYSQVGTRSGMTGADIAQWMMDREGIHDVALEQVAGELTDHYDPKAKVVRLSQGVYSGQSIAALGIAAHEVGHVIQHAHGYAPLHLRSFMYPTASIGTKLAFPLIIIGIIAAPLHFLTTVGVLLFAAATAFTLVTLPVEFNASSRALHALEHGNILTPDEMPGARSVLGAAAWTYVAAAVASVLMLLYYISLANRR